MYPFAKAAALVSIPALFLFVGCSKPDNPSLFDPSSKPLPQPSITSLAPAGSAVAGMDTIVVDGTNFSPLVAENTLYFNAQSATLLSASTTKITLIAPLVISDTVAVRVAVAGSYQFSNTLLYKLQAGVASFGGLLPVERSTALATDTSGNLYAAITVNNLEGGVIKVTAGGVRSTYAPATPSVASWTSLKMGPGGYLYSARNFRAIYRFSPGGGSSAALWGALPSGSIISNFDFDQNGDLWGGGGGTDIYRLKPDKTVSTYPFVGQVYSVRVYAGYLYFSARTDSLQKIWRAQISSGGLGTPEVYFDFGAAYPTKIPLAITFSSDGFLYIGTDSQDGLVIVDPLKSYTAPYKTYKASFGTGLNILAWGKADDLCSSTMDGFLLKFLVRGKRSAPYYGSTL